MWLCMYVRTYAAYNDQTVLWRACVSVFQRYRVKQWEGYEHIQGGRGCIQCLKLHIFVQVSASLSSVGVPSSLNEDGTPTRALGVVFHVQIQTAWISIRYDFTEFSLGSACSLSEEVLVRITSIRTGDCLVCFFAASAAKFWKRDIRSASERAFPVFFGDIFGCSNPYKKRCFSTQEFTRFLSMVSSQHRAMRSDVSFQTK